MLVFECNFDTYFRQTLMIKIYICMVSDRLKVKLRYNSHDLLLNQVQRKTIF